MNNFIQFLKTEIDLIDFIVITNDSLEQSSTYHFKDFKIKIFAYGTGAFLVQGDNETLIMNRTELFEIIENKKILENY